MTLMIKSNEKEEEKEKEENDAEPEMSQNDFKRNNYDNIIIYICTLICIEM